MKQNKPNNDEHMDFSNKSQREKFYKQLRKEIKAYDSNYENIRERTIALNELEKRLNGREEDIDDCRF